LVDKIKEYERGGACSKYKRKEKCIRPSVVIPEEKSHLEDISVDGMIMLN
jgi:hypothetical protein